jgi:RNA polymerase sigma factor (sigma-70 family)
MRRDAETARIEDLLEHAEWLRRLAAGLVHPDDAGDDVVQETWMAALRSPPTRDRATQPWLATVMRNLVRNRWRAGQVRRQAAAALAAEAESAAEASPQELLERAQLHRLLGEVVLDLEEPYRSAVLLRYYEGRDSAQISALLKVPAGTVRWRLKEGIERLRRAMDARHGGDRARWLPLLVPLATPGPGAGPTAARRSLPTEGAALMAMSMSTKGKILVVAALALLMLGAGGVLWRLTGAGSDGGSDPAIAARARALRPLSAQERALPPAAIEGEVRDPDGLPIAGAVVVLSRETRDRLSGTLPAGLAVSDRDGRFQFEDTRPGQHLVSASARGFAATLTPPFELKARQRRQVSLTLQPGGEVLHGRVLDEGGGPIPGARVTARIALSGGLLPPGPAKLLQALADGEGRYELALSPREYTVRAEANGYAPLETTVAVTRALRQDFRLHPAARLSGRIVERATGQPVAGADVEVMSTNFRDGGGARATRADGEGRFGFDDLAAGQYRIDARHGTLVGAGPVVDLIAAAGVEGVEVALDPAVAVTGRLIADSGRAVAGVEVAIGSRTAVSGEDGGFRIEGVATGRQRLRVTTSTEGWRGTGKDLEIGPRGLDGVEITVSMGGLLTGQVLRTDGQPAAGVYVRAHPEDGRTLASFAAETGPEGSFQIAGLPDGKATVQAWDPVLGVVRRDTEAFSGSSRQHVELRLSPAASISGLVRFDDGTPAAAVSVAFTGQGRGMTYTSVSTGDDGRFSVQGLLPGRYTVKARRKSGPWNLSTSSEQPDLRIVTVGADEQAAGVELVLRKGGRSIGGRVLLANGKPAAGTQVVANLEDNGESWKPFGHMIEHSGMVRDDGRFVIEDLKAGGFTLWAKRPGFPDAEVNHVAAGRQDVEMKLAAPASLSGAVTDRSGRPLPAFTVNLLPGPPAGDETPQQRARRRDATSFEGRTVRDPAGRFEWRGLSAGTYQIKIVAPEGASAIQAVTVADGEDKRGLRIVAGSGVRLRGKAVHLDTGAPLAGLRVHAFTAGRQLDAVTSAEGTFELTGLVSGEEVEVLVSADGKFVGERKTMQMPAGEAADSGLFRLMPGDFQRIADATGTFRMALQNRDDRASVIRVRPGSSADKAGLKLGDRILTLDGRDVQGLGAGAIHYLLARDAGKSVSLTVQAPGGEPRALTMVAETQTRPPAPAAAAPRQN